MNEDENIAQDNEKHKPPENKQVNFITSDHNGKQYKKEEDYLNPNTVLMNGFREHGNDTENCHTTQNDERSKCSSTQESCQENRNSLENSSVEMITLGSNNNMFMTLKTSYNEPIYTSKELPQFLQDSLVESLSRITISDDTGEKTIEFMDYKNEEHLPDLTALITKDLSEPYSIYTYRYFLHNWPQLSFLAYCKDCCVGAIVCKLDQHRRNIWRGYIAMLVVHKDFRRYKIGSKLVQKAIRRMVEQGCDEVVLETEVTNRAALNLYENLGFVRDKRLLRYYLNGVDAWRLKLWLI